MNVEETKIIIFGKGRKSSTVSFLYNGNEIEIVKEFKYLGVTFSRTGSFYSTRKYVVTRATCMYAIIKKSRELNLSIDCQLDMFDKMIVPILLYDSELWGFENLCIIEKLHLKFCKLVLSLKTSTPNFMIYGELVRYPLCVKVKIRC